MLELGSCVDCMRTIRSEGEGERFLVSGKDMLDGQEERSRRQS